MPPHATICLNNHTAWGNGHKAKEVIRGVSYGACIKVVIEVQVKGYAGANSMLTG